ncbi:PAS domain S-box protein [Gracilimonas sp.]|uniref:sensor histidine kinase n=1 Tax=Gracilimonas sp. TaxID=1974203 RepID=UPI002872164D|nr:PAS domain S-box protein [Gracilimonas sp.]
MKSTFQKFDKWVDEIEELLSESPQKNIIQDLLQKFREEIRNKKENSNSTDNLYKQIFHKAPIGILHYNSEGVIDACNEKFIEILNTSKEKIKGLQIEDIKNEGVKQAMENALKGKKGRYEGMYTSFTSGKTLPIRVEFHPELNEEGDWVGGIGMLEDISERYEANKKLRESEAQYRTIFEQNDSVMLLIDIDDGSIFDANPAALDFYGWNLDEITELKIGDINTLPSERVKKEMQKAQKKDSGGFHFKHRLANGTVKDVELYSGMIIVEGKHYLYSIVHDITERVKAKKELQRFKMGIDNSSDIVVMTNMNGKIEYVNNAFVQKYKYSREEVIGKTPRILQSGKYSQAFYEKYWNNLLNRRVMKGEMINKAKDGELVYIIYSTNPIVDQDGNMNGFIAIQHDITEQKEAEEELAKSLKEKEVLLSEIHHRVKNNLAIISALLELNLYQRGKDIGIEEFVRSSQMRIKAMAEVHEMLYQSEDFSHISFKEYVERLINKEYSIIDGGKRKVTFKTNIDEVELNINQAIPVGLMIDELIMNAIKHAFIEKDEGCIYINLDKIGEQIKLSVKDDGIGFSNDVDLTETDTLGMTLLKVLNQQLKGNLQFENSSAGLKCTIEFPIRDISGSSSNMLS